TLLRSRLSSAVVLGGRLAAALRGNTGLLVDHDPRRSLLLGDRDPEDLLGWLRELHAGVAGLVGEVKALRLEVTAAAGAEGGAMELAPDPLEQSQGVGDRSDRRRVSPVRQGRGRAVRRGVAGREPVLGVLGVDDLEVAFHWLIPRRAPRRRSCW